MNPLLVVDRFWSWNFGLRSGKCYVIGIGAILGFGLRQMVLCLRLPKLKMRYYLLLFYFLYFSFFLSLISLEIIKFLEKTYLL